VSGCGNGERTETDVEPHVWDGEGDERRVHAGLEATGGDHGEYGGVVEWEEPRDEEG
jgi:hypothetical protein